jgi:hypothetical protein
MMMLALWLWCRLLLLLDSKQVVIVTSKKKRDLSTLSYKTVSKYRSGAKRLLYLFYLENLMHGKAFEHVGFMPSICRFIVDGVNLGLTHVEILAVD